MRILVIEDNGPLRLTMVTRLKEEGFAVDHTADGLEARLMARDNAYAVTILDLGLPGMDGMDVLKDMRSHGQTGGVIILTARDALEQRVAGLDAGADDYLVKPVRMDELMARVRAILRRGQAVQASQVKFGPLEIDMKKRQARLKGEPVELTQKEFALLELLALRAGGVVSRSDIWEQIYDFTQEVSSNVVEVFIARLRKKLHVEGAPSLIQTRRGEGYLLEWQGAAQGG